MGAGGGVTDRGGGGADPEPEALGLDGGGRDTGEGRGSAGVACPEVEPLLSVLPAEPLRVGIDTFGIFGMWNRGVPPSLRGVPPSLRGVLLPGIAPRLRRTKRSGASGAKLRGLV